jgi:hypothetical protein
LAAVAGLAREVDGIGRKVAELAELPERVDEIARVTSGLARSVKALTDRTSPRPCPSWLVAPEDADDVRRLLDEVCVWTGTVYLRYGDASTSFPDCWLWHPDVVEELLWLMHAWIDAYQDPGASVGLVGDWHERWRPGVVRRIRAYAGTCSRDSHRVRPGWTSLDMAAREVPSLDVFEAVGEWWALRRTGRAPEPAPSAMQDILGGQP